MSTPQVPLLSPPAPQQAGQFEKTLSLLRSELTHCSSPAGRALIAQQLGVLYEKVGQPREAVAQWLRASNEAPESRESTAQLIRLIEQHRSFGNLPPLIGHACSHASSPEDQELAHIGKAWLHLNHERNLTAARDAILQALSAVPNSGIAAATLEVIATRLQDDELLDRALSLRITSTHDRQLRSLLLLDRVRYLAKKGEVGPALDLLDPMVRAKDSTCHWEALQQLTQLATSPSLRQLCGAPAQLKYMLDHWNPATAAPEPAEKERANHRSTQRLALALRASTFLQSTEQHAQFSALIDEVNPSLSRDSLHSQPLSRVALRAAYLMGRVDVAEQLVSAPEVVEANGPAAASRFVQLAELRFADNREGAAMAALCLAKQSDPSCLIAHARHLDRLQARGDGAGYAEALEVWAAADAESRHAHRAWVLAADAWARLAKQGTRSREALAAAVKSGLSPVTAHRLARAFARLSGDQVWLEDSSDKLLASPHLTPSELASLTVESVRLSLVDEEATDTHQTLERLSKIPEAMFLCQLCRAFEVGDKTTSRTNALDFLARNHASPSLAATLRWIAALDLQAKDQSQLAIRHLRASISTLPFHALSAGTLSVLLATNPEVQAHLRALRNFSERTSDSALSRSLLLEAGLREYWRGDTAAAMSDFSRAEQLGSPAAKSFLRWVNPEYGHDEPNSASAQQPQVFLLKSLKALGRAGRPTPEQIETAASQLARAQSRDEHETLESASPNHCPPEDVAIAAAGNVLILLHALNQPDDGREAAQARLTKLGKKYAEVAACFGYIQALQKPAAAIGPLGASAQLWAETSQQLFADLAWLATCQEANDALSSLRALSSAINHCSAPLEAQFREMAVLRRHALGLNSEPLLPGAAPALHLTNFEVTPAGTASPERIAVLESAGEIFDEESSTLAALLSGYHYLAENQRNEAASAFQRYADAFPEDPAGWEGLIATAEVVDREQLDRAVAAIAKSNTDPPYTAELLEHAAETYRVRWLDDLKALEALRCSVNLDPQRESCLTKLQALLTEPEQQQELLDVTESALAIVIDPRHRLQLNWTRAHTLRKLDRAEEALAAAKKVVADDPSHSAAHALLGEIYLTQGNYEEAIQRLTHLASMSGAPSDQRLTSGLAAVDLLEEKHQATERSLQVLLSLHRAGLGNLAVRERTARAAVKLEAWQEAVVVLEQLMFERETFSEQAEAARMALAIHRDRLQSPRTAGHAAEVLLKLCPGDAEALDLVSSGHLDPMLTTQLLAEGQSVLTAQLARGEGSPLSLELVAAIAKKSSDQPLLQKTLGALLALGQSRPSYLAELEMIEQFASKQPPSHCGTTGLDILLSQHRETTVDKICSHLDEYLNTSFSPRLESMGLATQQKLDLHNQSPLLAEIGAWAQALNVPQYEVYSSASNPTKIVVTREETTVIAVGFKVTSPLSPAVRQQLAIGLLSRTTGYDLLLHQGPKRTLQILAELGRLASLPCSEPNPSLDGSLDKEVRRAIPRKARKSYSDWASGLTDFNPAQWVRRGETLFDQVATLASGDPSRTVAAEAPSGRNTEVPQGPSLARVQSLIQFVFSPDFDDIRSSWELGPNG